MTHGRRVQEHPQNALSFSPRMPYNKVMISILATHARAALSPPGRPYSLQLRSRLYVIVTAATPAVLEVVRAALRAGAGMVQYDPLARETREAVAEAAQVLWACRRARVPLIVSGRCDVALAVTADGVHLTGEDMPVALARRLMGPAAIVGVACHTVPDAREAERQGATYVAVGPVFGAEAPPEDHSLGLSLLGTVLRAVRLPVCATGGVTLAKVEQLRYLEVELVAVDAPATAVTREMVEKLRRPVAE